jgi:hypothetical protein
VSKLRIAVLALASLAPSRWRDPNTVRLFAVGPYFDETDQEKSDRNTTGGENDSPARQLARYAKDVSDQAPTDMSVRIIYNRPRASPRSTRTTATSTRTSAWRTACSTATCSSSSTSTTSRASPRSTLPRSPARQRAGDDVRRARAHLAAVGRHRARVGRQPGSGPAGYEIVYRDTIAPYWTHTIKVDKATTRYVVKGITKDNFLFGVRAVDRDGKPQPGRVPATGAVISAGRGRTGP